MNVEFDLKLRLRLPDPADLSLQSLYFFNTYRSGSSIIVSIARSMAKYAHRTAFNLSGDLYNLGVEYFDSGNYQSSSIFLTDSTQLEKLTEFGGYLYCGFREVPLGFAEAFKPIGASVLVVRDPRDIGISQYYAAANHATDNRILAEQIGALRKLTQEIPLETFLLRDDTIEFLNRIVQCYEPMIRNGMPVITYESMYRDGELSLRALCEALAGHMAPYLPEDWNFEAFLENAKRRIATSPALKGHKTGGSVYNYTKLDPVLLDEYTDRLKVSLALLDY